MLFKKPALALTSASHLSNLTPTPSIPSTCPAISINPTNGHPKRTYTTAHDNTHSSPSDPDYPTNLPWPPSTTPPRPPTPYAIFNLPPAAPYSKRRFYELVKLYHPDRHKHSNPDSPTQTQSPTPTELIERYRLVIAANAILSDPSKREAYDRFGTGWVSEYGSGAHDPQGKWKYGTRHRWRTDASGNATAPHWPVDQDPMFNATWEDWERWYAEQVRMRRGKKARSRAERWSASFFGREEEGGVRQNTVYASNYAFISVVFLLAALGGAGQATRANGEAKTKLERTGVVNDQTSKVLMEARQSTQELRGQGESKDKRIRRFLSDQGDYGEGEFDARVLREGDQDLCAPGLVKDRGEPRFWQKPPEDR